MRLVAIALLLLPASALAAIADTVAAARAAYLDVEHERAMRLLEQALQESPNDAQWIEIHELQAVIHVTYDRRNQARDAMKQILLRRRDYVPPPQSPPKILEAYGAAKAELTRQGIDMQAPPPEPPRWYTNKWLWLGVGVVAAGVTTYVLLQYNDPDAPRADFPIVRFGGP